MDIELAQDFDEFLKLLNAHGVKYLVVGGYAVGLHGFARATEDLDVWIAHDAENANRTCAAVREFGFDVPELTPQLFMVPKSLVKMGVKPVRIEIMTSASGVSFEECYPHRAEIDAGSTTVSTIGLDDLKANKRAAARDQDLADLRRLP